MSVELDRTELLMLAARRRMQQEVRKRFALRLYKPHSKEREFHENPRRARFLFWGNRTGKTIAGAVEACRFALGKHPYRDVSPRSGWVVSPTFEVQRDVAQEALLYYLPANFIFKVAWREKAKGYMDRIVLRVNTCSGGFNYPVITFKSADQGREVFQGPSVPWIWFDEEVPLDVYRECLVRTLDVQGDIWGTMTPILGDLYLQITDPPEGRIDPEVWFSHASWADNPYLPESEQRRLLATMDPAEIEVRVHGRWVPKTGRVFPQFREDVHLADYEDLGWSRPEPPDGWRKVAGFDYGLRQPTAFLVAATDGEIVVFCGEHYAAEREPQDHARSIQSWIARGWKRIKADPTVKNRGPDKRSPYDFYRALRIHMLMAARGEGAWENRMELWRQFLSFERDETTGVFVRRPRLYILKDRCPNLARELRNLRWKESRSGTLREDTQGDDHSIDAGSYILEDLAPMLLRNRNWKRPPDVKIERNPYTGY